MQLAERLYTQGFIRVVELMKLARWLFIVLIMSFSFFTESTAYPSSFDFRSTLGELVRNPTSDAACFLKAIRSQNLGQMWVIILLLLPCDQPVRI
ncbi:hypothetical protein LINGRAHAP2_LOCUS24843 [Linum grandiflorum]